MKQATTTAGAIRWTARILCILFAAFISIFALDVFDENYSFWTTVFALLIHLIPTFLVLIVLYLSWHREWIGTMTYSFLALLYLVGFWGKFHWSVYLLISGPLLLIALLFWISWKGRKV